MKKIISVMLILTALISVGSMCFANSISQEMDVASSTELSKDESGAGVCCTSDQELKGENAVVGDLAIVKENVSIENDRAGFLVDACMVIVATGWFVYEVIIPLGTLVLVGGVLIYAAVTNSKEK